MYGITGKVPNEELTKPPCKEEVERIKQFNKGKEKEISSLKDELYDFIKILIKQDSDNMKIETSNGEYYDMRYVEEKPVDKIHIKSSRVLPYMPSASTLGQFERAYIIFFSYSKYSSDNWLIIISGLFR